MSRYFSGVKEELVTAPDHVDRLRARWRAEQPDLDTSPVEIFGRIHRISSLITPGIEEALCRHGLDRGEFDVLATLRRQGPPYRLTPTELYAALLVASGSLTHRLGRLEKAGLVRRVPSEHDGRSLSAELTEAGSAVVIAAYRDDMAFEASLLEGLRPEAREELADALRRLMSLVEGALARRETVPPD
jgi:DNA-binding MarR family transcriptional regulator